MLASRSSSDLSGVTLPDGVSPDVAPLFSPSGLVYRYVLTAPTAPMELKTINDWVLTKAYKAVPGVADMSGFGGQTMQYQVLVDPTRLAGAGLAVSDVATALGNNNGNAGGGFYSEGGQFYYVRGLGRLETPEDIGNVVAHGRNGTPILVKDVGTRGDRLRAAPRPVRVQRERRRGRRRHPDAHRGAGADGAQGGRTKTKELNDDDPAEGREDPAVLRSERSDRAHDAHGRGQPAPRHRPRGRGARLLPVRHPVGAHRRGDDSARAAVRVHLSRPRHIPANLLSIGAIDFGILVDGAVVMVENIHRTLARRHGTGFSVREVIVEAASEVDRPIVYAVAVIVAGFLPIYVLSGPSGRLFTPMADTTIYALIGALVLALTTLPVLCAWCSGAASASGGIRCSNGSGDRYASALDGPRRGRAGRRACAWAFSPRRVCSPRASAPSSCRISTRARSGSARRCRRRSRSRSRRSSCRKCGALFTAFPEVTDVASEHGRPDDGTDATGFFNAEFFVGLKPYREWTGRYRTKADLIAELNQKLIKFPGIAFIYTQPAEDAVDEAETGLELARGQGVRL